MIYIDIYWCDEHHHHWTLNTEQWYTLIYIDMMNIIITEHRTLNNDIHWYILMWWTSSSQNTEHWTMIYIDIYWCDEHHHHRTLNNAIHWDILKLLKLFISLIYVYIERFFKFWYNASLSQIANMFRPSGIH